MSSSKEYDELSSNSIKFYQELAREATDEKVVNEPTFRELSKSIYNTIKDSDLAGFNSDRSVLCP